MESQRWGWAKDAQHNSSNDIANWWWQRVSLIASKHIPTNSYKFPKTNKKNRTESAAHLLLLPFNSLFVHQSTLKLLAPELTKHPRTSPKPIDWTQVQQALLGKIQIANQLLNSSEESHCLGVGGKNRFRLANHNQGWNCVCFAVSGSDQTKTLGTKRATTVCISQWSCWKDNYLYLFVCPDYCSSWLYYTVALALTFSGRFCTIKASTLSSCWFSNFSSYSSCKAASLLAATLPQLLAKASDKPVKQTTPARTRKHMNRGWMYFAQQ